MKKVLLTILITLALLVPSAAAQAAEDEEIRVAVIDTGISTVAVSPDNILPGKNYVLSGGDTEDKLGHGTAVSAIIVGSEAARITGICPGAKLVPLVTATKDENGATVQGDTAMAAKAIRDAVDIYGCRIINISSGAASSSWQLRNAVSYAQERGALVIASAGNNQKKNPGAVYYPGGYDSVLCVGAANSDGSIAAFSQQNDTVDLLLIAVHPDYQKMGVNAVILSKTMKGCHKLGIRQAETGPMLELNDKVQSQWKDFQTEQHKRRRCFIKEL